MVKNGNTTGKADLGSDVPWKRHLVAKSGITSGQDDLCSYIPPSRSILLPRVLLPQVRLTFDHTYLQ